MPASERNAEIRHYIVGKGWRILCTLREYQLKCLMSLDTATDRGIDICHQWHQGQWGLAWRVTLEIIQLVPPAHSFGDKSEDWARCEASPAFAALSTSQSSVRQSENSHTVHTIFWLPTQNIHPPTLCMTCLVLVSQTPEKLFDLFFSVYH